MQGQLSQLFHQHYGTFVRLETSNHSDENRKYSLLVSCSVHEGHLCQAQTEKLREGLPHHTTPMNALTSTVLVSLSWTRPREREGGGDGGTGRDGTLWPEMGSITDTGFQEEEEEAFQPCALKQQHGSHQLAAC